MLGITRKASGHERERYGRTTPPPAGLPAFILFAILALIGWVAIPCQPLALAWVPAVGCSGDGQMGPLAAEKVDNLRFDLGTEDARELAYYKAPQTTLGVLAPRGWHCFYLYGSGGVILIVTTDPLPQDAGEYLRKSFAGPAVVLSGVTGGTSGRFPVAQYSARLFPEEERTFIKSIIDEAVEIGYASSSDFPTGLYPDDQVRYKSPCLVEFETPAGLDGLGTSEKLRKSADPIYGFGALVGPRDEPDFTLLTIRVPDARPSLRSVIIENAEPKRACFQ